MGNQLNSFIDANIDTASNMLIKANVAYEKEDKLVNLETAKKLIDKTIALLNAKN